MFNRIPTNIIGKSIRLNIKALKSHKSDEEPISKKAIWLYSINLNYDSPGRI